MSYTVQCQWLPVNNFLFQIANIWLLISYFCPLNLNGLIYLRLSLGFAGLFFGLWGWLVLCALDTALWNFFFFVGNMVHLGYILLSRRTKKFTEDMEGVYKTLFKPRSLPRHQFKLLAETAKPERILFSGEIFVIDGVTVCDSLSIMMEGRMEVRKHGLLVHVIEEYQFINSPEWIVSQEEPYTFEVTMQCQSQCRILSWDRLTLLNLLKRNHCLKTVTDFVVSADVAQKLFAMNRRISTDGQRTHSLYSLHEIGHHEISEVGESSVNEENNDLINCKTSLLNHYRNHSDRETVL